jgi:hypothetical protein
MENITPLVLIDGVFTPTEAQKILLELINTKISYHKLDDFSNHIRFNNDPSFSKARVAALINTSQSVKEVIEHAIKNKLQLKINSEIIIELVKN